MTDLARKIDHTLLNAEADRPQVLRLVAEAQRFGFAAVCVNGVFIPTVAEALAGSAIKTCAVAGFPLGADSPQVKAHQAATAARNGANEIDFVPHLPYLLHRDQPSATDELTRIVEAIRTINPQAVIKVILETALLMNPRYGSPAEAEARIQAACEVARGSGCDFVKTSTGFHPDGGATVQAVQLLKKHADGLSVKASGGIRHHTDAVRLVLAGADRLGCSRSVPIVTEAVGTDPINP